MLSTLNNATLNDVNDAEIENVVVNLNDAASMVTSLLDDVVITVVEPTMKKVKRAYRERPVNWKDIARHYEIYQKVDLTIREYNLLAINGNVGTWNVTFNRWIKDIKSKKDRKKKKRICVIGEALDNELAGIVDNYQEHGVPMRNLILKTQLQTLLEVRGRQDILDRMNYFDERNKPGSKWFIRIGDSWCNRFYKRHNIKTRIATTKMRDDIPIDYEIKKQTFIYLIAKTVKDHNVPDELIAGIDETNNQFVPSVKSTKCRGGAKRVRLLNIGKEKPQITNTFGAAATGEIIKPVQSIFGGKTSRCHPNNGKTAPPEGQYYDHSESHWQTPSTFITYLTKAIIAYKNEKIRLLNLPANQVMILFLDLHYSHKDEAVLALMKANNIIPIFIPAGCTDLHQICDVILNKPFKNGVKDEFVEYVSMEFANWYNQRENDQDVFKINMALSAMKPLMPTFVARGIARLETPEMKEAIRKCYQEEGLLRVAMLPETYEAAVAALPVDIDENPIVPAEVEAEEDLGPVEDPNEARIEQVVPFEIEVNQQEEDELTLLSDSSSDSSSDSEEPVVTSNIGRVRKANTMLGSVKRGKYSKAN